MYYIVLHQLNLQQFFDVCNVFFPNAIFQNQKKHDSQRFARILCFFLRPEIGQFSPHCGADFLLNYTEQLETKEKIHWRNFKKIQWRLRPEIADFCLLLWSNVSWILVIAFTSSLHVAKPPRGTRNLLEVPKLGHMPRGSYPPQRRSRHLLETPLLTIPFENPFSL